MGLEDIKRWIIEKYSQDEQPKVEELVWLKKTIKAGEKIDWSFVDTVDYDIDSIPRKRELILDFKAKPKELRQKLAGLIRYEERT